MAQILQQSRNDTDLLSKISFAMASATGGQMQASQGELIELLHVCLRGFQNVYIVIDGIDECDNAKEFIHILFGVCEESSAKLLLFSRPNVASLRKAVKLERRIIIDKRIVQDDIELYLKRKVNDLLEDQLLVGKLKNTELVSHLLLGADGMFLWARLMISYLNSPALTPSQRIQTIKSVRLPEGLDAVYERSLALIGRANVAEQDLVRRVFIWLAHAKYSLKSADNFTKR